MALTQFGFQIGSSLATQYLTDSKYIRAGFMVVETKADMEALPKDTGSGGVIIKGSLVYVSNDSTAVNNGTYRYNGTSWIKENDVNVTVPSGAIFTDTYVSGASFTDETSSNSSSPLKMTLSRSGSLTSSITSNLPKVSSTSAGVAPKGAAVSSQTQSTKFLREDGTWAAPSYTTDTNTHRPIQVNGSEILGNNTTALNLKAGTNVSISNNSGTVTISASEPTSYSTQKLVRPSYLNGTNDVTLQTLFNSTRANRLAFLPADQIIIEKTTDGGVTWVDAGYSDSIKLGLFSETRAQITIPLLNGIRSTNCGLRVTFTGMKYNVPAGTAETAKYNYWNSSYVKSTERYCQLKEMYFWVSAVNDRISVKVERATGSASTTWSTIFNESSYGMTGWSGNDYIRFAQNTFGGGTNQPGNYWNYRLTFMTMPPASGTLSTSSNTSAQAIMEIRGYGDSWWTKSNNYMASDHLYNFNASQDATFPAKVTATGGFVGALSGNATTATNLAGTTSPHYVYVGPASGSSAAAPAFRALVAADIPDLSALYLTSFTETDPTVPSWAKQTTKPTYTASEIGLSNVENTALSTWTGSSNITTIGTLSSGTVPWARLSNVPSTFTPSSHTHGNIQNDGTLQTTDITIANGDKIIVTDASNSNKIARTSVAFDGTTESSVLSKKGTWVSLPTAQSLGLEKAMRFIGVSTNAITNGGDQNTGISGHTKTAGDVVLYGNQEFVYGINNKWILLGDEGSYKIKQTAVTDPVASDSAVAFIDSISQNANGDITVSKKYMYAVTFKDWTV